jgi:phage baseplate assembly protein W
MAEWMTLDTLPADVVFGASGVLEVMQNVRTILTTRKGTQPLDRDFGISFDFLDSPLPGVRAKMEQEAFMALRKYEPRAILGQIIWNDDPLAGKVGPKISIQVKL